MAKQSYNNYYCLIALRPATDGGIMHANNSVNCSKRMLMFKVAQSTKGNVTLMQEKSSQFMMNLVVS
jgi:hypothetical protein